MIHTSCCSGCPFLANQTQKILPLLRHTLAIRYDNHKKVAARTVCDPPLDLLTLVFRFSDACHLNLYLLSLPASANYLSSHADCRLDHELADGHRNLWDPVQGAGPRISASPLTAAPCLRHPPQLLARSAADPATPGHACRGLTPAAACA
jgi:hypothetical protein